MWSLCVKCSAFSSNITYLPLSQHLIYSSSEVSKHVCEWRDWMAGWLTGSKPKLTIFVKAWRKVGQTEEGGGWYSTADLLYLPQRSLTWETCAWTETDTRITQRSCYSARQEESILLIVALKGRKKGLHGWWQYHHFCFLDTARFDVSLCAETLHSCEHLVCLHVVKK